MDEFVWMARALGASQPADLQSRGVTIYEAPEVPADRAVVNLVNGVIVDFSVEGEIPAAGFYGDLADITSFAERSGRPLGEQSGALRPVRRSSTSGDSARDDNGTALDGDQNPRT